MPNEAVDGPYPLYIVCFTERGYMDSIAPYSGISPSDFKCTSTPTKKAYHLPAIMSQSISREYIELAYIANQIPTLERRKNTIKIQ